jgi:uncharacterized protein DUF2628
VSHNPYAAPGASLALPAQHTSEAYLAFLGSKTAFFGSEAAYYEKKWAGLRDGTSRGAGFNWAAAFFPTYWLFYRRFIPLGIAVWVLAAGLEGGAVVLASHVFGIAAVIPAMLSARLVEFFVVGFAANVLLYRRFERAWAASGGRDLEVLRRRGGTSTAALWIAILISVLLLMGNFVPSVR